MAAVSNIGTLQSLSDYQAAVSSIRTLPMLPESKAELSQNETPQRLSDYQAAVSSFRALHMLPNGKAEFSKNETVQRLSDSNAAAAATCGASPHGTAHVNALDSVILEYTSLLHKLQSRAQAPPPETPTTRRTWARGLKEDSFSLTKKLTELAADALEAAALGISGSMDVYTQAGAALVNCASCHKLADDTHKLTDGACGTWSAEQSFKLDTEHGVDTFALQLKMLDRKLINSVTDAVKGLNAGSIACPEGYCIVHSSNPEAHFVLYRSDKKNQIVVLAGLQENTPTRPSYTSSIFKATVMHWATNKTGQAGRMFGYQFQKLVSNLVGDILKIKAPRKQQIGEEQCRLEDLSKRSVQLDSRFEATAKKLHFQRTSAQYLLEKYVVLIELHHHEIEGDLGEVLKEYRNGLEKLEQSFKELPEITPEYVHSAEVIGAFEGFEASIQSLLVLGKECEASAHRMGVVAPGVAAAGHLGA